MIAALQMLFGHSHPWLPGFLRRVRLRRDLVLASMRRLTAAFRRVGLRSRRRLRLVSSGGGRRLLALSAFLASLVVLVPIPFGNQLPALAVAAFGFGLVRRDGVMILAGHALTLLALGWAAVLLLAGYRFTSWTAGLLWN